MTETSYVLTRLVLGEQFRTSLDEKEYRTIISAHDVLLAANDMEDIFENLVLNYVEFEQEVVSIAVRESIVFEPQEYIFAHMQTLCRRLANVLGSARSYRDQGRSLTKKIGGQGALDLFDRLLSEQYDQRFGYRLIENLRDYSQHVSQPVSGISLDRYRDRDGLFVHAVKIRIGREDLLENEKLKASFRKEIEKSEVVGYELRPALREYMAGLCGSHETLRKEGFGSVTESISVLESTWERFGAKEPEDLLGVAVIEQSSLGARETPLSKNMVSLLKEKQDRYSIFTNLEKRFATGRATLEIAIQKR